MTDQAKPLFHKPSSTRQFLVSKTSSPHEIKKESRKDYRPPEELKKQFPDLLSGNQFTKKFMERADTAQAFSAMAVRIDSPDPKDGKSKLPEKSGLEIKLGKILEKISRKEKGVWGALGPGCFGCILPDKNSGQAEKEAHNIKSLLSKGDKTTVTIGIALYPTIHFKKKQIMDNARKALEHAEFFGPDSLVTFDAVSLNISGDKYYDQGNIPLAIDEFKSALLLDPSNVNVHNSMGVCYGVQNEYKKALEAFMTAVRYDPDEIMALYNVGLAHSLMGAQEKALEFFLSAHGKNGDIFEIILQTGKLYTELNQPEKARPFLEKAVRKQPDSAFAYSSLGLCYEALDLTEQAISSYKMAIRKNPSDAASLSALGRLFSLKGENPDIAILFCRQSVDLAPENGLYRFRLGELYLQENRLEEALAQFEKAAGLGHPSEELIEKTRKRLDNKTEPCSPASG